MLAENKHSETGQSAAFLSHQFGGRRIGRASIDLAPMGPSTTTRSVLQIQDWPVEFLVQTEESLMRFCAQGRNRRRPTTMRLVGSSIVLVDP